MGRAGHRPFSPAPRASPKKQSIVLLFDSMEIESRVRTKPLNPRGGVRNALRTSLFLLACVLAAGPARAGAKDNLASTEKEAKKACISGDYAKGVALLSQLYVDTNNIIYVFNQGRCLEQNGRYEDAILRFREYARKLKNAGRPEDAEVDRHIADCQALLAKPAAPPAPAAPATVPAPVPTPAVHPPSSVQDTNPAESVAALPSNVLTPDITQQAPSTDKPGKGLRVAGIVTFGLGIAGLATGVILNVKANAVADEMEALPSTSRRDKENTRARYETYGWVAYSAGAACAAGGALLYYLGYRQGRESQVAFVPMATANSLAAVLQGAF